INVAMAQRWVRRVGTHCREEYELVGDELKHIAAVVADLPKPYEKPNLTHARVWRSVGCEQCGNTGFAGRVGIFEVFLIDDTIERLILEAPSEVGVHEAAKKQGMLTIHQDGALKTLAGLTTWAEVVRVTGE
ncbi:MAG: type IV pilus assembly protein PilB, partial [Parcubacteria group bacterium Gr01-1014_70]